MQWHTFWRHYDLLTSWCVLYFKANYLLSCDVFHDLLFIVLTFCFINVFVMSLTSWYIFDFTTKRIFDVMPSFCIVLTFLFIILGTKYYENVFLMSLTLWYIFDFMVNFWRHDKLFVIMPCFWWTFWRPGKFVDVMICFWHHDEHFNFSDKCFDVILCFWRHSKYFDVITCFWLHDKLFWHTSDVMTNLLTLWCVCDVIDVFLTCLWHHD